MFVDFDKIVHAQVFTATSLLSQLTEAAAALEGRGAQALGLPAALMRAQLALAGGDRTDALRLLAGLPNEATRHQPAFVATTVSLQVLRAHAGSIAFPQKCESVSSVVVAAGRIGTELSIVEMANQSAS